MDGLGVISAKVVGRAASSSADKEKACDLDPSRQLAYLPHSSQPAAGPQMASRGEQVLKKIPQAMPCDLHHFSTVRHCGPPAHLH